jgi:3'(2'), 5'-bisphosphate nucleotidase
MTSTLLPEICAVAERAGAEAMRFYNNRNNVTLKPDASPLTDADRASHELIVQALPQLLSGVPVVSEESKDATLAPTADRYWLVDPLDGTKEFLKGTGEFTVNIALIEQHRPVLGVVHAPAIGLTYYAALDHGAFRQIQGQAAVSIKSQPYNFSRTRVVASKDHAGPLVQALLSRLPNAELKSMGSSLKFCLVASGDADIYLRDVPTMEWDTAAAQCVVEAAGGRLLTLEGQPLRYGKPSLKNPSLITIGDPSLDWRHLTKSA